MKHTYKTIPCGVRNKVSDRFVMRTLVDVVFPEKQDLADKLGISLARLWEILSGRRGTESELLDLAIVMKVPYSLFGYFFGPDAREARSA